MRFLLSLFLLGLFSSAVRSSLHITKFSELDQVPSTIFLTDGIELHFDLVLNAAKNYLSIGGNPKQFFVMTYSQQTTDYLKQIDINTIFFSNMTRQIQQIAQQFHCLRDQGKFHFMAAVRELKVQLWLELCRIGKQSVIFDHDVVFREHPAILLDRSLIDGFMGPDIVIGYFTGAPNLVQMAGIELPDFVMDKVDNGIFEVNFSPIAVVNPKKMYPILLQLFQISRQHVETGCEKWGTRWGQILPNVILYNSGLRWEQVGDLAKGVWSSGCSQDTEFCLTGGGTGQEVGPARELLVGKWAGAKLRSHVFTQYAGWGGFAFKAKDIMEAGDWFLPCKFTQGFFSMELFWEEKDTIMDLENNCILGLNV